MTARFAPPSLGRPAPHEAGLPDHSPVDADSIDPTLVERLVADQFPQWRGLPVSAVPEGGWDNRTFRLGDGLLVRLPSAERYAGQVAREQRWLPVLAARLPVPIPEPVGLGVPGRGYPYPWSVYRWLPGRPARRGAVGDPGRFAEDLARFLASLQEIDAAEGPPPGPENFFRGAEPGVYDGQTREAIARLGSRIDADGALRAWETACAAGQPAAPAWVHGDMTGSNLLVADGRLSAVIDFGCLAVGDPACDLAIAWTWFADASRAAFRHALAVDRDTWRRARGWALWKALITLVDGDEAQADAAARRFGWTRGAAAIVGDVIEDSRRDGPAARAR